MHVDILVAFHSFRGYFAFVVNDGNFTLHHGVASIVGIIFKQWGQAETHISY